MSKISFSSRFPKGDTCRSIHLATNFRLHRRDLPGSPDIVLPRHAAVVFVHGCFWHRHPRCKGATTPKSRVEFWQTKFATNVERDKRNRRDLRRLGWKVVVVWECELKKLEKLETKLRSALA